MDIFDYLILAILLFSAWDGYRTGFVAQLVRLFGTVLAYIAAWQFHGMLSPTLDHFVLGTILKNIHNVSAVPVVGLLDTGNTVSSLAAAIANALAFGIVFYVALILIRYLGHLLNAVVSLPVLSAVNRLSGLVAGGIVAFLLIAVFITVATYFPASPVKAQIQHSALAPIFSQPVTELEHLTGVIPGRGI